MRCITETILLKLDNVDSIKCPALINLRRWYEHLLILLGSKHVFGDRGLEELKVKKIDVDFSK